jgi:hypothetical protein
MPAQLGPEAHQRRPSLTVEVEHELVLVFRREAAKRDIPVTHLIHRLLGVIGEEPSLVTAILDDGA